MKRLPELTEKQKIRFWEKVDIQGPDDCWNWTGSLRRGYGKVRLNNLCYGSHRIAYFLATQKDPGVLLVCHSCDNPKCCNPCHLWIGTNSDNMLDCYKKDRAYIPCSGSWNSLSGSKHPQAKLTDTQVYEIRALRATKHSLKYIATLFGISLPTVSQIANRKRWTHI